MKPRSLRAAALEFAILPDQGGPTSGKTGATVREVAGPLRTTMLLLEEGGERLCLVSTHFNQPKACNLSPLLRGIVAAELGLPPSRILLFVSHNHTDTQLAENQVEAYAALSLPPEELPEPVLLPVGEEMVARLREGARRLRERLQNVTVSWTLGREGRITYNRKGRRADGNTYLMREEDREVVGADFNVDIYREALLVLLKNDGGEVVAAIVQFTGHPVSCYHPEKPVVFGDWPQVACEIVGKALAPDNPPPVAFLQGCAADVNAKGMFRGGVDLSRKFGEMLAGSYLEALPRLRPSARGGFDYAVETVGIPLAPLPDAAALEAEIAEMEDFIRRAADGDEDTLACVGLNFPRELTPAYRGKLVEGVLPWSRWALERHRRGEADAVARSLPTELYVLRLGDVAIVGMPFEPFQGIGRRMRAASPLPLMVPCGYVNNSYGYLTDGSNTGDGEYMSAHYRYSRFRPPYATPAGDVLAIRAVETLRRFV